MADSVRPGRWRLRPGYRASFAEVLAAKRAAGRRLTVRHMEQAAGELEIAPAETGIEVNADGYRGPELDRAHSRYRILALGDSCTFGSPCAERYPYARALETELRAAGHDVEVVNGGVEGYSPSDVLARLDELQSLRPEMTTLYIGWNALFRDRFLDDARGPRRYLHVARLFARALEGARAEFSDRRRSAIDAYERPRRADRSAPELGLLDRYRPAFFPEVERIVDGMEAVGSRVVLVTLPGLYSVARDPSPQALAIGHLPEFTDNAFVLARMAERHNEALRALAAERGLAVVDLERWARDALAPPEEHFIDSVHLDELGQQQAGAYLARELAPRLSQSRGAHPGQPASRRAGQRQRAASG
jgi:lysophospholipase L1-like esterase